MAKIRPTTSILILSAVCFLLHHSVSAYVLNGSHILSILIDRIGSFQSLAVSQKITFYPIEITDKEVEVEENLKYQFPENFRSDTQNGKNSRIYIDSGAQDLTILNGKITDSSETEIDNYKGILFYRNRVLLENRLKMLDIDVSISSLGRFNGKIFYIIGAKYPDNTKPQLWIDKETFHPLRLFTPNAADPKSFLEFRYIIWQKNGNVWYPMQTEIYRDERLIRKIKVKQIGVNQQFAEDLFNIAHLQLIYPKAEPVEGEPQEPDELKDVQQSIEDFKKIFE